MFKFFFLSSFLFLGGGVNDEYHEYCTYKAHVSWGLFSLNYRSLRL